MESYYTKEHCVRGDFFLEWTDKNDFTASFMNEKIHKYANE